MTETKAPVTWLTQEAYDRLKGELDYLAGPGRADIVQKIEAAREEGDLKENGGYHAAKEEQGKREARIRQLTQLLESAQVGETPADTGVVEPGMLVTVELGGDELSFLLGSREAAASEDVEVYSDRSPLGAAILGRRVGEEAIFTAPNGKETPVRVVSAKPYTG